MRVDPSGDANGHIHEKPDGVAVENVAADDVKENKKEPKKKEQIMVRMIFN